MDPGSSSRCDVHGNLLGARDRCGPAAGKLGRTTGKGEEREDDEAKREATAATGDDRFDPGRDAASGRAASRFPEPAWSDLRGLTADERRAILEYFKRINAPKP